MTSQVTGSLAGDPDSGAPSTGRALVVLTGIVVVIGALHSVSRFGLTGPIALDGEALRVWLDDPVAVIATVARWLALILSYYLAFVVAATVVLGDRMANKRWGWLATTRIAGIAGIVLGTTVIAAPIALDRNSNQNGSDPVPQPLVLAELDAPLTLSESPDQTAESAADTIWSDVDGALNASSDVDGVLNTSKDDVWTVASGDSFWSIAEETLRDQLTSSTNEVSDEQIAQYWQMLIAANQDRLVDPGNPDLILPGQQLHLPPTP